MSAPSGNDRAGQDVKGVGSGKTLSPEAKRALAEAEARRKAADETSKSRPKEVGGRDGPDPARYGDWETGGIVSDF